MRNAFASCDSTYSRAIATNRAKPRLPSRTGSSKPAGTWRVSLRALAPRGRIGFRIVNTNVSFRSGEKRSTNSAMG